MTVGTQVRFFVAGDPVPQGSLKAFANRKTGRAMLTSTSGKNLTHWRDAIGWVAREHCDTLAEGPVQVLLRFRLTKPKSVPKRRGTPVVKPDIDKLARAALDALTGVCFRDDAQVISLIASKAYCNPEEQPGVDVEVMTWH